MNLFRIAYRALRKTLPLQLTYFVTSRCNLDCAICFYHAQVKGPRREELTLEEVERLCRGMPQFFWLLVSGGEPYLRRDLVEIVELFRRHNRIDFLTIPTAGFFDETIEEMTARMLERCPGLKVNVNLSIQGIGEEHDQLAGMAGSWERLCRTEGRLRALRDRHSRLKIGVTLPMSSRNQMRIEAILEEAMRLFRLDNLNIGMLRGDPYDPTTGVGLDVRRYREAIAWMEREKARRGISYFGRLLSVAQGAMRGEVAEHVAVTRDTNAYLRPCHAGRISVVLSETGDLYACELRPEKLGNVRDAGFDFDRLWRGAAAEDLRGCIRRENCRCHHECNAGINTVFDPQRYHRLLGRLPAAAAGSLRGARGM